MWFYSFYFRLRLHCTGFSVLNQLWKHHSLSPIAPTTVIAKVPTEEFFSKDLGFPYLKSHISVPDLLTPFPHLQSSVSSPERQPRSSLRCYVFCSVQMLLRPNCNVHCVRLLVANRENHRKLCDWHKALHQAAFWELSLTTALILCILQDPRLVQISNIISHWYLQLI